MTEQQWEFCELCQSDSKEHKGRGYSHDVWVRYYGPNYAKTYQLAELDGENMKIWTVSPFHEAMRLLGAAGWELVSHQFASGGSSSAYESVAINFRWNRRAAMFQRPVQPGRVVDEPKLTELIKP